MALVQTQPVSQSGLTPALQACAPGGDGYRPTATTVLLVKNGDSVQHTLTVHTTATAFGQPISNIAVVLPASSEVLLGPYDPGEVAQAATGLANLTYDDATHLTIAALAI